MNQYESIHKRLLGIDKKIAKLEEQNKLLIAEIEKLKQRPVYNDNNQKIGPGSALQFDPEHRGAMGPR